VVSDDDLVVTGGNVGLRAELLAGLRGGVGFGLAYAKH